MLLYLLKVLDGAWPLSLIPPLVYYPLSGVRGRGAKGRFAALALLGGILAGTLYAVLKRNTGWVVREYYDLAILSPLLILCLLFLIFFPLSFKKGEPGRVLKISAPLLFFLVLSRALPDLFTAPLDFDVGLDSVFNREYLSRFLGYALGVSLLLALFAGASFLLRRLGTSAARALACPAFLCLSGYFLLDAVRIMYVRRLFLSGDFTADLVIFFMERENLFLFLELSLFALAALFLLAESFVLKPSGANPALLRKSRYSLALNRRAAVFLLVVIFSLFFAAGHLRALHERGPYISEPENVTAENGEISLPLEVVEDGNLHRYAYQTESGVEARFIVIRKAAGAYGVGLDACDICGATGYYQRGDQVICKLCDVVMNKTTIGFPGGCNPVPLAFRIEPGRLVVESRDLEAEERRFR
ncbi:MAG: DUF2318 domain-containing protein [Deltaproteobacteria bacterium]|jgi:uncharacterized membrane protein|nr:DUF2318 domain-containing protein [Deltaproteobacteria bacterium]